MRWLFALLLAGVTALAGCRNEKGGPTLSDYEAAKPQILAKAQSHAPAAPAAAPAPAAVVPEPPPQAVQTASFTYDPTGKRDPFRSFVLDRAKEESEKGSGPLEQFDVSQLAVVAVVWDTGQPRALMADPSGRPYIVAEGTAVGKNDGRIIRIDDDMVLVKETYVDWLGEKSTKDIEMRLHGGDKGGMLR